MSHTNSRTEYNQRSGGQPQQKQPVVPLSEDNYADLAEKAIRSLKDKKDKSGKPLGMLTTSQIRNLLAMTADIYNEVVSDNSEKLSGETIERISYLRIRFVYEAGRNPKDPKVRNFVEAANVIEYLKKASESRTDYIRFSRYMEALVAYHRYYGGMDQ